MNKEFLSKLKSIRNLMKFSPIVKSELTLIMESDLICEKDKERILCRLEALFTSNQEVAFDQLHKITRSIENGTYCIEVTGVTSNV